MVGVFDIVSLSSFYFLIACITYIILRHVFKKDRKTVLIILVSAILVRLFVYLAFNLIFASNGFYFPDSIKYDNKGWECAQDAIGVPKYSKVTCFFYSVFGHFVSLPELLNVFLGAWVCVLLFLITKSVFGRRSAVIVAVLAVFNPAFVFWSTQLLKDTLILFISVLILYLLLKYNNKNSILNLLVGFLVYILGIFRFYVALLIVAVILFSFFVLHAKQARNYLLPSACLVLSVLLALHFLGLDAFVYKHAHSAITKEKSLNMEIVKDNTKSIIKTDFVSKINDILRKLHDGRTAYERDWEINSPIGLLKLVPSGTFYLFFAPVPWHAELMQDYLFGLEMILWYALIPFILFGLYFFVRNKKTMPLWVFALSLSLFYSIFAGNVGTIVRWRMPIFAILLIPAGIGISKVIEYLEKKQWLKSKSCT